MQIEEDTRQTEETFPKKLQELSARVWEKELFNSPFLLDLYEGKLPKQKFAQYLIQDYHYLVGFSRAMAMATARAEDLFIIKAFYTHLKIALEFEYPRVQKMITYFGIRKDELENSSPKPGTVEYASFLLETCKNYTPAQMVAAIYPCIFSYGFIGKRITLAMKKYYKVPTKYISFTLYQKRVFTESGANTLRILEIGTAKASRAEENKILDKFYAATKFERRFWDQNY